MNKDTAEHLENSLNHFSVIGYKKNGKFYYRRGAIPNAKPFPYFLKFNYTNLSKSQVCYRRMIIDRNAGNQPIVTITKLDLNLPYENILNLYLEAIKYY